MFLLEMPVGYHLVTTGMMVRPEFPKHFSDSQSRIIKESSEATRSSNQSYYKSTRGAIEEKALQRQKCKVISQSRAARVTHAGRQRCKEQLSGIPLWVQRATGSNSCWNNLASSAYNIYN